MSAAGGKHPFAFLITAAGSGTRMGSGVKKEFRKIDGKPVLAQCLDNFLKTNLFSFGLITCKPGTGNEVKEILSTSKELLKSLNKPIILCDGGRERQESVYLGLQSLDENFPELKDHGFVLIHDGARPWASPELITRVAEGCREHSACAPVIPSIDAMKALNSEGIITGHHPRKETVSVQTPQGFSFSEILIAHQRAAADGRHYIDDTEIFSRYEGDVYTTAGSSINKKITYEGDLHTPDYEGTA